MAFLEVASDNDEIIFAITSADPVFTEFQVSQDTVIAFKQVSSDAVNEKQSLPKIGGLGNFFIRIWA